MTTIDLSTFQIEKGTNFTEYEPPAPTPDYPIEIHSLGDFDVVSDVGRNLLLNTSEIKEDTFSGYQKYFHDIKTSDYGIEEFKNGGEFYLRGYIENLEGNENVGLMLHFPRDEGWHYQYHNHPGHIKPNENGWFEIKISIPEGRRDISKGGYIAFRHDGNLGESRVRLSKVKLEKGTTATDWTPAPEDITENDNYPLIDKINLLLSEPLRSRGNDCDRLIKDSDGLWKIERNIELIHPEDGTRTIEETYGVLDTSIYEELSQEYQYKLNNLRSFEGSNYVYTLLSDGEGGYY